MLHFSGLYFLESINFISYLLLVGQNIIYGVDIMQKEKKGFKKRYSKEEVFWGYAFLAPLLIGVITLYIIPVFSTFYYSFTEWGKFGGTTFVGLENYKKLFQDEMMYRAVINTIKYTIFTVPLSIGFSIFFATLLNTKIKLKSTFRVIYFLPAVTTAAAIAMIFKWIFNTDFGILNSMLGLKIDWLTNPKYAMTVLVVIGVWSSLGKSIVLYLAGLQGISRSFYEAAEIDGSTKLQSFRYITLPLLTPVIFFQLTTGIIGALQIYDAIFIIFSETNPALPSVISMSYMFYREGFTFNNKGYSAAIAVFMLVITLIITAVNLKAQKKWVIYD